jgi:hypothetical protein
LFLQTPLVRQFICRRTQSSDKPFDIRALAKLLGAANANGNHLNQMAKSVGHSEMSSISSLIAASISSRVFAGFFKLVLSSQSTGPAPLAIRTSAWIDRGNEPLAIRYRRRTETAGDDPSESRALPG